MYANVAFALVGICNYLWLKIKITSFHQDRIGIHRRPPSPCLICLYFRDLIGSNKMNRFLLLLFFTAGVFAFGLFATDIFVNAGQVATGNLAPYFLSVCKPNYTGMDCHFNHQFIANGNICTGNQVVVERARRSFPSKDASLSVYSAVYVTVRHCSVGLK